MSEPLNLALRTSLLSTRAELQKHEDTDFALFRLQRFYFESGQGAGGRG